MVELPQEAPVTGGSNHGLPELAGYTILRPLGRGGTGKVYLARQQRLERLVAIKVLDTELSDEEGFLERFSREAQAAAMFQHPHVVPIYDASHDPETNTHFIAFEYMPEGSLEDLLAREPMLSERRALEIVRAIADALAFAQERKLLHRDVKPGNILLSAEGVPKLSDLGLARRTDQGPGAVTQAGLVVGTPYYMAPEQALGRVDLDIRVDIYSLGLCLWRMLTGLLPFVAKDEKRPSVIEALTRRLSEELPDVRTVRPEITERTAKLLKGMVARRRQERYRDPKAVRDNVARILAGEGVANPSVTDSADHLPATRAAAQRAAARAVGSDMSSVTSQGFSLAALAVTLLVGIVLGAVSSRLLAPPAQLAARDTAAPVDPDPRQDPPAVDPPPAEDPPLVDPPPLDPPPVADDPPPVDPLDVPPVDPPVEDPPVAPPVEGPPVEDPPVEDPPTRDPEQVSDDAGGEDPPLVLGPPLEYSPERATEISTALLCDRRQGISQLERLADFERDPAGRTFVATMRLALEATDGRISWAEREAALRNLIAKLRELPPGAGRSARTVRGLFGTWEQTLDCVLALRRVFAEPAGRAGALELFSELPPELGYAELAGRVLDLVEALDDCRGPLSTTDRRELSRNVGELDVALARTALGGVLHEELKSVLTVAGKLIEDPRSCLVAALHETRRECPDSLFIGSRFREIPTEGALSDMPAGSALLVLTDAPHGLTLFVGEIKIQLSPGTLRLGDQRLAFDWTRPRLVYIAAREQQLLVRIPDGDPTEVVLERPFPREVPFTVSEGKVWLAHLELLRRPSRTGTYRPRRGEALRALLEQ